MLKFQTINDIPLNQSAVASNHILNAVANGKAVGNIILFGANGSGKSTLARHLPVWFQAAHGHQDEALFAHIDVPNELNVASLKNMCMTLSTNPTGYDWIILDEADKPSDRSAFAKLHGVLEFNPDKLFVLTANTLGVFPPGIVSRCTTINIVAPTPEEYLPHAQRVLSQRGVAKPDAYVLKLLHGASIGGHDCRKYERAIALV